MDTLLGQAGDGQVDLLRSAKLDGVAAGELRLLQNLNQIAESLLTGPLAAVSGGNADGGESVVSRGGQVLCFPLLDIRRQFAAAIGFQFLYHVRTNLGNQAKDVFSGEGFKTLPIHRMADRHIAGKAQQTFVHILRPQLRPHSTRRVRRKIILFFSSLKIPFLHLLFYVFLQCIADLLPAHQPPQGIAECNSSLIGESLQRQFGQIPLQELVGKKGCPVVISHHSRVGGVIFTSGSVQHILNAEIRLRQHLRGSVRLVDQIVAVMYAITLWQTHGKVSSQVC